MRLRNPGQLVRRIIIATAVCMGLAAVTVGSMAASAITLLPTAARDEGLASPPPIAPAPAIIQTAALTPPTPDEARAQAEARRTLVAQRLHDFQSQMQQMNQEILSALTRPGQSATEAEQAGMAVIARHHENIESLAVLLDESIGPPPQPGTPAPPNPMSAQIRMTETRAQDRVREVAAVLAKPEALAADYAPVAPPAPTS